MPTRAALRVLEQNNDRVNAGKVSLPSKEAAVLGAYQVLAEAMGATLELDSDGQVVLYTGYFKPSAQQVGYIEARDLTPEEEAQLSY